MASMFLALAAAVLALLFVHLISKYTIWKRKGIPTANGFIPIMGHFLPIITLRKSMSEMYRKVYVEAKNRSMIGLYTITAPVLLIREPQLVKTVMQTNFSNFHENGLKVQRDADPLLAKNPFFTYGEEWSVGRKRLTYAFSSLRLKILFETVKGVCKKLEDYVDKHLSTSNKYEVELKSLFAKYTGEIVANAGLGIEGFSFEDKPHPGSFYELGKVLFEPDLKHGILNAIILFMPKLNNILKIPFIPKNVDNFMRQIVKENMEVRRKSTTPRNDFLQLMIDLEKSGEQLDEEALAAYALSFFADGYETTSITLSFIAYQLATHPDIQQKLRDEITSTIAKHGGTLTYDSLREMTYMDQVISESQRVLPAVGFMTKRCTEEFELQGSDGLSCRVNPGTEVIVPIHGLHLDPKYWTDPEVFDPERFDHDRKNNIEKMTFIPFGEGPRMCVGMRMALLQIKACLATLLRSYKLELSSKTQLPLQISPLYFLTAPVGGLWAHISKL